MSIVPQTAREQLVELALHGEISVAVGDLGERLSSLRLCEPGSLGVMRRSLEQYGQLSPIALFIDADQLEIVDGFKRVRVARALGWPMLRARVADVSSAEAKLRLREIHDGRGLCEIEEAWLVRSLYRDEGMSQPEIARRMGRHKSWVWRRLMLVEALDPIVQADVRLGLISPRAAVALSRLPRGNQQAASAVLARRGMTSREGEAFVDEVLALGDAAAREALIAARLEGPAPRRPGGRRPSRPSRGDAATLHGDALRVREIAARLEARLLATPLEAMTPAAAELVRDALVRLVPVLRALERVIGGVKGAEEVS